VDAPPRSACAGRAPRAAASEARVARTTTGIGARPGPPQFLKSNKLERNRKTGFKCPRGCGKGSAFPEACPGKIDKSHPIHPRNEESKKKKKVIACFGVRACVFPTLCVLWRLFCGCLHRSPCSSPAEPTDCLNLASIRKHSRSTRHSTMPHPGQAPGCAADCAAGT
jgi:hypothetical protein